MNNAVSVNCTTDRNNHVNYHGSVKECNVKVLSYYNIAITTKSTMALNIVRRYQNNMIENQKSTDHDDNSDRKRHGQTNHGFNSAGRRTTDATNQQITKCLAYYKCFKSDLLIYYKCFKSVLRTLTKVLFSNQKVRKYFYL